MNCQEVDELSGAYALRATSPEESVAIAAHVASCSHHAELRDLEDSVAALAFTVPEMDPPPGLRERIVSAVLAEQSQQAERPASPVRAPRRWFFSGWSWPRLATYGFAAAIVLTLGALFVAGRLSDDDTGGTVVLELTATAGGATAEVLSFPDDGTMVLESEGMAPLAHDRVYQVWSITDGMPVGIGTFEVSESGEGSVVLEGDISHADVVAVTVEPAGGSEQPTTDPVLIGDL